MCFSIRFRKLTNAAHNLDADICSVNNLFAPWIRQIDITQYCTNKSFIPTTTPKEVYRYSDSMLKCFPKNFLKVTQKFILYSKILLIIHNNEDGRSHTNTGVNMRIDDSLEEREDKIEDQIDSKYVYRVPLKYFCNLGKINFPTKIDLKILCTLQTNMKQLFKSKKTVDLLVEKF